jgi:hypothetical protein
MIDLKLIFPTKNSFVIFNAYMTFFVFQGNIPHLNQENSFKLNNILFFSFKGILIRSSTNEDAQFTYNPAIVVLLTEVLKFLISVSLCLKKHSYRHLIAETKANKSSNY